MTELQHVVTSQEVYNLALLLQSTNNYTPSNVHMFQYNYKQTIMGIITMIYKAANYTDELCVYYAVT